MFTPFAYIQPGSVEDVVTALGDKNAFIHAGGTDLLGCLRDDVFSADKLVSLSGLKDISGVSETSDGGLVIGALTTITDVAEHPLIQRKYAGLAQAAADVASPQLRNQGTLGGNLCQKPRCWYYRGDFDCLRKGGYKCFAVNGENEYHCIMGGANCFIVHPSDPAPALVALDAEVAIVGPGGRRRLPVSELHMPPEKDPTRETVLQDAEVITAIHLPPAAAGRYSSYRKIRTRRSWDFAVAGCALAFDMEGDQVRDCRVVLAAAAPVPWRSREAEEVLRGNTLNDGNIRAAARAAVADARPMSNNAYKIPLFEGLLREEFGKIVSA